MSEYDLFDLIPSLPFDLSEQDSKEHDKAVTAIKKKIREVAGEINNAHVSEKPHYIAQRDFLKGLYLLPISSGAMFFQPMLSVLIDW